MHFLQVLEGSFGQSYLFYTTTIHCNQNFDSAPRPKVVGLFRMFPLQFYKHHLDSTNERIDVLILRFVIIPI